MVMFMFMFISMGFHPNTPKVMCSMLMKAKCNIWDIFFHALVLVSCWFLAGHVFKVMFFLFCFSFAHTHILHLLVGAEIRGAELRGVEAHGAVEKKKKG
jgi:hypothetical protein